MRERCAATIEMVKNGKLDEVNNAVDWLCYDLSELLRPKNQISIPNDKSLGKKI